MKHTLTKFTAYINSCTNQAHLMAADTLISIFKLRYPGELVAVTRLQNALQLRRIDIQCEMILNGAN